MPMERKEIVFPRFGMWFGVTLSLIAVVLTVVSVYFGIRAEKTEVAAQVLASDELTTYHPELEAKFTYAGEEVRHLWKLKVRFLNSGDKTIVGEGNQSNILGNGLNFAFPDETRMLRIEEEADTFESDIVQTEPNRFQIQFRQWRSGEYSIVSFCIASDKPLDPDPFPTVPNRDIIDGDVVVQDLTERRPEERMFVVDRLPIPISMMGKILGGVITGIIALALVIFVVWAWKDSLPVFKWKRQYLSNFFDYLDQIEPKLSRQAKEEFKKRPYELPEQLWAKFEGEKVPSKRLVFDNITEAIGFTIGPLLLAFGLTCLILMLIPA